MRRRRCDRILARIAVAWAFVLAAVPSSADRRAVSGRGAVGEWELVWRISKTEGLTNLFRQVMGEEAEFPVRWRRIVSSRGDRLLFFDRSGEMDSELALSPGQQGIASHDGSAYVLWTEDPIESGMSEFEFYLRDAEEPSWSAKAAGEPLLMARDGAFFVIASLVETSQHFGVLDSRGKVELVGSGGEIRGELPIYPAYASTTGDGERVAFLHDSELIVLGRDGLLDWQRRVPVDHLAPREGMSQVDARAGLIAIGGTGRSASGSGGSTLQPGRRGVIRVFDDEGTLIWKHDQPRSDDLWFQLFPAI